MSTHKSQLEKVELFRAYDPVQGIADVPDPYYQGGFEEVYAIVERTCHSLLTAMLERYGLVRTTAE